MNAAAEGISLERGQENVARILQHGGPPMTMQEIVDAENPVKPARRTRSDAGKPRVTKPEAVKGARPAFLTVEQAAHLDKLVASMMETSEHEAIAHDAAMQAQVNYHAYLAELQGK